MSTLASHVCIGMAVAAVGAFLAPASDAASLAAIPTHHTSLSTKQSTGEPRRSDSGNSDLYHEARKLKAWILDSNDNRGLPFLIVDKKHAVVWAFHADGALRGMSAVLLGMAVGDDSVPGIGERKLATIRPDERTTPAGRFVAALDHNLQGVEILWVDYDAAISLHRVVTTTPQERRAQRLASPTSRDNRISYGCINVTADFFDRVIGPAFKGTNGVVYVLPETRSAREVFGSYDVAEHHRRRDARPAPGQ